MNTTNNAHYKTYLTSSKTEESQSSLKRQTNIKLERVIPTWIKDLAKEVVVWGLIYAGIIGFFLLFGWMISRVNI